MDQKKFLNIISTALKIKSNKISFKMKLGDIEEWDSIGHLSILSAIDKATKGKSANIKGLGNQNSVRKIWQVLVKNKLAK